MKITGRKINSKVLKHHQGRTPSESLTMRQGRNKTKGLDDGGGAKKQ
jgi:hypothetical protein